MSPKCKLLREAKALLFPIRWKEPFGMVMPEAMACGTPVIALNHPGSSVEEIVDNGVNGFRSTPSMTPRAWRGRCWAAWTAAGCIKTS